MRKVFSFYFDGTIVQAVQASISDATLTVQSVHTCHHHELDDYLSGLREKNFIISYNPVSFHQDVMLFPPAASKQYDKLVHSEVRKLHPELSSFSSFFATVGQTTLDTRLFNKIAAFSYDDIPLAELLAAFSRHGHAVQHIYAAPHSIFRLIDSISPEDDEQARLLVASLPGEKVLLLAEKKQLEFVRKLHSSGDALQPADVRGINMTLDYCFQSFRVKPVETVLLDQSQETQGVPALSAPFRAVASAALASIPARQAGEYLAPLAAALHYFDAPALGDLLPANYLSASRNKKILRTATRGMTALALALAAFTLTQWRPIARLKTQVALSRSHLGDPATEVAAFKKLDSQLKGLGLPSEIARKQSRSPHPAEALASLKLSGSKEYVVKSLTVHEEADFSAVQIEGEINGEGFGNLQAAFERMVEQLAAIPGYAILSRALDIEHKTFTVKARYGGIGPVR